MKNEYDVIVVGGGPAGSMAARTAAEGGVSVLLLEKDREIGVPVRCAEGIAAKGLKQLLGNINSRWIAREVNKIQLIAPDGTVVDVMTGGQAGYILHRKLFDFDLAVMASEAGVDVITRAYVYDVMRKDKKISGVKVQHLGRSINISGKLIIGADGIESRLGRHAGLNTRTLPKDMVTCVQMTLADIDIDPETIVLYFGKEVAPGGYAWVFPKGPRTANVGLGISGVYSDKSKPIAFLRKLVKNKFPNAKMLTLVAGGVPCVHTLDHIVADGVMLVGDAAHQVNPLSGGGIFRAITAGQLAGQVAAEAVQMRNVSEKQLSIYPKEWYKMEGKNNERRYRIREVVNAFTDEDLNRVAHTVNSIPLEKRTILQVFKTALFKHPKLIFEAVKVFEGR